jgi:hypothetical protein
LRSYRLTGSTLPESRANLSEFSGEYKIRINDILPMEADLQVACTLGNINIKWHFELKRKIN